MTDKDTFELEHQLSIAEEIESILRDDSDNIPNITGSEYLAELLDKHNLSKTDVISVKIVVSVPEIIVVSSVTLIIV